eukprot:246288_1
MSLDSSHIHGEQCPPARAPIRAPVPVQTGDTCSAGDMDDKALTLTLHLNDELVALNTNQMLQIMKIITTVNTAHIYRDTDETNEDRIQSEYILDLNDTFLHSMFGDINAKRIKHIVDHKLMLISMVLLAIIMMVLRLLLGEDTVVFNVYLITWCCVMVIPWLVFKHLLFNKVAFNLCIHTFDFWIKVGYGLMFSVAALFYHTPSMNGFTLTTIRSCIDVVFVVLCITYISSLDAVHSTKTKTLIGTICGALLITYSAVCSQFLWPDEDDVKVMIQLSNGVNVISMQSLIASSSRILAIFFWKQMYKTWKSKGRAVAITISPKITWIDATTTERNSDELDQVINEMDSVIMQGVSGIDLKCMRNGVNSQGSSESDQGDK